MDDKVLLEKVSLFHFICLTACFFFLNVLASTKYTEL